VILNIKGSNRRTRKLVDRATWWYAEKLMGKRLMSGLEIYIKLRKNLITKEGCEGTANIENTTNTRPKEFIIELDVTFSIRDILITLAHEMVHVKQWAKGEMYDYMKPGFVRFEKTKFNTNEIDYWDFPWEIDAFGRQLGLFVRFIEYADMADDDEMQIGVK
jgi:hypothetical protein